MINFSKIRPALFLAFTLAVVNYSCSSDKKEVANSDNAAHQIDPEKMSKGFQLLESNCFSCHSPNAGIENRVAPPMIAIKKHYIDDDVSKEKFTKDLIAFVNNPSEEISKMPGAVNRFGLMPKMSFSETDITAIAEYIYETELEAPGWFEEHYKAERKKYMNEAKLSDLPYLERGQKMAMSTKGVLGKNLLTAINTKGTVEALAFCNERAYPLTDSMAVELNAKIKRVSDQARNPKNVANENELAYIQKFKENLSKGEKTKPEVQEMNGKMVGYYPIMTNQMCMQCHGQPEAQIKSETLEKIDHLYPSDKARGYDVDELRGIWVIEMEKD